MLSCRCRGVVLIGVVCRVDCAVLIGCCLSGVCLFILPGLSGILRPNVWYFKSILRLVSKEFLKIFDTGQAKPDPVWCRIEI